MTVSDTLKQKAWLPASDLPLMLLTIDHDDLASPIQVVNNTEDVTSRGNIFVKFPFDLPMPDSREDAPPRTQLRISNVSREIVEAVRSISSPATVTIEVVDRDDYDTVEASFANLRLVNVTADALVVSGDLRLEQLDEEPYPAHSYVPSAFPGLIG